MKAESGNSRSIWAATYDVPKFNPLNKNDTAEICVIGAGITGLLCAYLLVLEGKDVIILEDGNICSGETGRTTAHITTVIDDRFYNIERLHGEEGCRLAAQSQLRALDLIESIINKNKIECDFKRLDGYLLFREEEAEKGGELDLEHKALTKAGIQAEIVSGAPLEFAASARCLKFPDQAEFHVLKFLSAIANLIITNGGKIYTHTHAKNFTEDESGVKIEIANGNTVSAKKVITATNSPVSDYVKIHLKQAAYRTYVIGTVVPKGSITKGLYWDTEDPYHYIRTYNDGRDDILIVGGEDHKTGQDEEPELRFERLVSWTRERFRDSGEVRYKWSGQVMEPFDGLSYIGLDPESKGNIYISTGDSGMGMTHSAYSAILLRDMITGKENKWAELYDPKRINLKAASEFLKEGFNTAVQYLDVLAPPQAATEDEIQPGSGAIMGLGLDKLAVYKDEKGNLFKFSALCPHLKCIVEWNKVEKTWDCPCHGSRFDSKGKVINGPALADMKQIKN